jgi:uncharacterized membrane protein
VHLVNKKLKKQIGKYLTIIGLAMLVFGAISILTGYLLSDYTILLVVAASLLFIGLYLWTGFIGMGP